MTIIRIGLDTSKHVFQVHGVDEAEQPVLRRQVRRSEMGKFFGKLAPARIGLEACGASHHWARVLRGLGHAVVLIAPQYVKPYVKRGKNDAIDAAAICEAMSRPGMRFVPIKSAEQQAGLMVLKVSDPKAFRSGRHFAAALGITPREHSTAGRHRPGRISRQGDESLRRLLVLGAMAQIRFAKPGRTSPWLLNLLARKPKKLAAIALANKMARTVWAMMVSGETYRQPKAA